MDVQPAFMWLNTFLNLCHEELKQIWEGELNKLSAECKLYSENFMLLINVSCHYLKENLLFSAWFPEYQKHRFNHSKCSCEKSPVITVLDDFYILFLSEVKHIYCHHAQTPKITGNTTNKSPMDQTTTAVAMEAFYTVPTTKVR